MIKTELMTRYAAAKFASYSKKLGGVHEATVATKFALEDAEIDFKRRVRQESEAVAIEVLAMDVEDAESVLA